MISAKNEIAITFVGAYDHSYMDTMIYVIIMSLMPSVMYIRPRIGISIQVVTDIIVATGFFFFDPSRSYYLIVNFFTFCFVSAFVYYLTYTTKQKLYLRDVELMKASEFDHMTNLANRRRYENELMSLRQGKYGRAYVIMIFDINGLKVINDTKGHNAGDELIKGAAECIKKAFGDKTKCFRIGGDEFATIIYKDKHKADLDTLLNKFEDCCQGWKGELIPEMSISYGYADAEENGKMSVDELIVIADQKMYEMKEAHYKK